jgi:hypothetical protein
VLVKYGLSPSVLGPNHFGLSGGEKEANRDERQRACKQNCGGAKRGNRHSACGTARVASEPGQKGLLVRHRELEETASLRHHRSAR